MERISGDAETRARNGHIESRMHMRGGDADEPVPPQDDLEPLLVDERNDTWDRLEPVRERAGEFLERARDGVKNRVHRAEDALDERTGLLTTIREKPLLAVGVAFSVGLIAAAVTPAEQRNWVIERARRQLRGAILSGLTAALIHELRDALGGDEGLGELVTSLLGRGDEEYPL